jgi:endonuclease YncB( thermonuclease family)
MGWVRRTALIGLVFFPMAAKAAAAPAPDALPEIAAGAVRSVEDGVTVTLADGRVLRLAGLLAPTAPLALGPDVSWPVADAARTALDDLVRDQGLSLRAADAAPDRHGRLVGQAILADGTWLQRELLKQGRDRLEPTRALGPLAAPLLKAEADARRHHRGLWRLAAYAVRNPDHLTARDTGTFVLVEGTVLSVAPARDATYLDFAQDWHHGFTVRIPRAVLQRADGFDPASLEGAEVRVRGWLAYEGRPILDLDDVMALEPLPKTRKPTKRR